jgi:hypothetical protein
MFQILADVFQAGGTVPRTAALEVHPGQLSRWLDELWGAGPAVLPLPAALPFLGDPNIVAALDNSPPGPGSFSGPSGINPANPAAFTELPGPLVTNAIWHHLVYAYLLENTGVVEIFAEVIRRATHGETLEIQGNQAVQWLRATEELFFREPPLFSITGVTSQLRPEARIVRRNLYWRMLAMDLSHPLPRRGPAPAAGAQEWKQHTGNGVNSTFREKWSELLRQVWLGIENRNNAVGANATDDAYLLLLCESLRDMLTMRRRGGFLAREEFASVAVMSWFDLTLSANTPIVVALNAQATSPADRLALIAQQVGMVPAPRSRELFELAVPMSLILRVLEANGFNSSANVSLFYNPNSPIFAIMNRIIDLWQSATGERVKDRPVGNLPSTAPPQPVRIPATQPVATRLVPRTGTGGRS